MLLKISAIIGLLTLVGLLAMTVPTTVQLSKLDVGLRSSLKSTNELVGIESAVIQKNQSLGNLVATAGSMSQHLLTTEQVTTALEQNIQTINQLNKATLSINHSIGEKAHVSSDHLAEIAKGMRALSGSTEQLASTLSQLDAIVQQDETDLGQMTQATHNMNAKVPGVAG